MLSITVGRMNGVLCAGGCKLSVYLGLSNRIGKMYLRVAKLESPRRYWSRPVPTACFYYFATPMGVVLLRNQGL